MSAFICCQPATDLTDGGYKEVDMEEEGDDEA